MSQWIVVDDSDSAISYSTVDPVIPWIAVNKSIPGTVDLDNSIFQTGHVLSSNGSLSFSFTGPFTCSRYQYFVKHSDTWCRNRCRSIWHFFQAQCTICKSTWALVELLSRWQITCRSITCGSVTNFGMDSFLRCGRPEQRLAQLDYKCLCARE